jgi:hypothetical protein
MDRDCGPAAVGGVRLGPGTDLKLGEIAVGPLLQPRDRQVPRIELGAQRAGQIAERRRDRTDVGRANGSGGLRRIPGREPRQIVGVRCARRGRARVSGRR